MIGSEKSEEALEGASDEFETQGAEVGAYWSGPWLLLVENLLFESTDSDMVLAQELERTIVAHHTADGFTHEVIA